MPKHSETKSLPYSADQMFELVADVARYPEFLPWCSAARVRSHEKQGDVEVQIADLVISFKVFRERYTSKVTMRRASSIETEFVDGPFRHLISAWAFRDCDGGCEVDFSVDFEFKNPILQGAAGLFFYQAMQRIVRAFEDRAATLYASA